MNTTQLSFADLPAETLVAICDRLGGDGHGLYKAEMLTNLGVPQEYVDEVTHTYKSDGTHKGSIYPTGSTGIPGDPVVPEMTAVYSLSVYQRIGMDLGLPRSQYGGRGYQARDWDERIRKHLKGLSDDVSK